MADKVVLNSVASFQNDTSAVVTINNNNALVTTAIDNTLSRDGTTPNQMLSNLDMNSNQILNLPSPATVNSPARLIDVTTNPTITVPPTGTSGATVPFLNGNNTWSGTNTWNSTSTFAGTTTIPFTQAGTGATSSNVDAKLKLGFLNARDFGAVGDGIVDDTTALQNCINRSVASGTPVFINAGTYKLTATLTITGACLITGAGILVSSKLAPIASISAISINTTAAVMLRDFDIVYSSISSPGTSAITFSISSGNQNGSRFENLFIQQAYVGIDFVTSGTGSITNAVVRDCYFSGFGGTTTGILFNSVGGSLVGDNLIDGCTFSQSGAAIAVEIRASSAVRIMNSVLAGDNTAGSYGVYLNLEASAPTGTGDLLIIGNSIENRQYGVYASRQNNSGTWVNTQVIGNEFEPAAGGYAVYVPTDGTGAWLLELIVNSNLVFGPGSGTNSLISIDSTTDLIVNGNLLKSNGGTTTGIAIGSAVTYGLVTNNRIVNTTTALTNASTSIVIKDNPGYNPVGVTAAATMGTSPFTVTAGPTPETHYIRQSATNTATITKGGQAMATLAGATTYYTVELGPNESYITTWATTAPTYTKDVH